MVTRQKTFKALTKHFGSQAALARALGLTRGAIHHWGGVVPPDHAIKIEKITQRKFTRHQIRPDYFGRAA